MQFFVLLLISVGIVQGALDNKGRHFMIGFMDNKATRYDLSLEIFITTQSKRPVTVNILGPHVNTSHSLQRTLTVHRGQVKLVNISKDYRLHGTEMSSKGIAINANHEIIVYGINREVYSTDGYLALPIDALGTEYYTVSYTPATHYTILLVVGVRDNTNVAIRLARNSQVFIHFLNKTYHGGEWMNVTLHRFDTFELNSTGDLTGTYIKSDQPITVLSGNKKTRVGNTHNSQDHLVEQLMPVQTWGKNFALVSLPGRTTGDEYRFIASEDNTHVTVNALDGKNHAHKSITLQKAGQFVQRHFSSATYVHLTSDKPIQVMQFADTQAGHGDVADPCMITVPPVEQYAADYTFTTPHSSKGDYTNYFIYTIDKNQKDGLRIDGHPITHAHYHSIPGSNLVTGVLQITVGTHTVSHTTPTVVFGGILFGSAKAESYGFPVGLLLSPINNACKAAPMRPGDEIDNDCDGEVDEEVCNNIDDDGDGRVDEDCKEESVDILG